MIEGVTRRTFLASSTIAAALAAAGSQRKTKNALGFTIDGGFAGRIFFTGIDPHPMAEKVLPGYERIGRCGVARSPLEAWS